MEMLFCVCLTDEWKKESEGGGKVATLAGRPANSPTRSLARSLRLHQNTEVLKRGRRIALKSHLLCLNGHRNLTIVILALCMFVGSFVCMYQSMYVFVVPTSTTAMSADFHRVHVSGGVKSTR